MPGTEKVRVLIVRDSQQVGERIERLLEKAGYTVAGTASNTLEAAEMTQAVRPDVVVMGITLPNTDGIEATRRILAGRPTPVVVLSAFGAPDLVRRASEAGVGAYLSTSASARHLQAAIGIAMAHFDDTLALQRLNAELKRETVERTRVEQALQESAGQLKSQGELTTRIVESIPSSMVVIDRSLRIVSVNRNFLEKARRQPADTIGRRIDEVLPLVLVDRTRMMDKLPAVFRDGQVLEGGRVTYRGPGVPTRAYFYRLIPLSGTGAPEQAVKNVMLLMDDITERERLGQEVQRAQQHLASVVECANDLVVSLDPEARILTWNQAAERVSGLGAEQVSGQAILSLCADEHRAVMSAMLQRLTRGERVQSTEVDLLRSDGQQVPIAWSCSSMQDEAANLTGIVAVGRDLTERRHLEAQLFHSAKMASLGVMAGGIAHEVRNPLGIISAAAQLLLERPEDIQLRSECVEKIYAATQRASLIIESLMKFARPQKGPMQELDLGVTLEETLKLMSNQLTVQSVVLTREIEGDLPQVRGHPSLLQQVFSNIILNACNAMPEGGTLTVACRPAETGDVEIRFSDTGSGIAADDLPQIFDPFFTTMPVGKGTGLGLSISYSIIREHGGSIEVDSQVGRGTSFVIRLPVAT
jgi:PAS domain S-box-containing protein